MGRAETPAPGLVLFFALCVLVAGTVGQNATGSLENDIAALRAFRAALVDAGRRLASWDVVDGAPCVWKGVLCTSQGSGYRVTGLQLPGLQLSGPLPGCFNAPPSPFSLQWFLSFKSLAG